MKDSVIKATENAIAEYLYEHLGKRFNALNTVVQEASMYTSLPCIMQVTMYTSLPYIMQVTMKSD